MKTIHLLVGLILVAGGLVVVNYYQNSFIPFIIGVIAFWFGSQNLIIGSFAPAKYLQLMQAPKQQWTDDDKLYVDRAADRINSLEYYLFFGLVVVAFAISYSISYFLK